MKIRQDQLNLVDANQYRAAFLNAIVPLSTNFAAVSMDPAIEYDSLVTGVIARTITLRDAGVTRIGIVAFDAVECGNSCLDCTNTQ